MRVGKSEIVGHDQHGTLWVVEHSQCMREAVVGMLPWRIFVAG